MNAEKKVTKKAKAKPAKKEAAKVTKKKSAVKKTAAKKVVAKSVSKPAAKEIAKPVAKKAAKKTTPAPAKKTPTAKKPSKKTKVTAPQSSLRIRLRGFDYRQLDQATEIIVNTVRHSGASIRGPIPLPTSKTRYDLLRSPHVDKDSREQIEIRTYHRLVDIPNPSEKTAQALSELQMPEGVSFNMNLR